MRFAALFNNRVVWGMVLLVTVVVIGWTSVAQAKSQNSMSADLMDAQGRMVGSATLSGMEDGTVQVKVTIAGMQPVPGDRRMALAGVGSCQAPDFTSAGDDLGTFPNIQFYASGSADYDLVVEGLDLHDLVDADGSSLLIYADVGEQPGPRIVCGVLKGSMTEGSTTEGSTTEGSTTEGSTTEAEATATNTPMPVAATNTPATNTETDSLINKSAGGLLMDRSGRLVGLGILVPGDGNVVGIGVALEGMQPIAGGHRIAIAKTGACQAPDFTSAGDELVQLPEIQFYADGSADYVSAAEGISISSLLDSDRSALIIYADKGDQPGDRIACAELQPLDKLLAELGIDESEVLN